MRIHTALVGLLASVLILTACSQPIPGALGLAENQAEETTSLEPAANDESEPTDPPQDPQTTAEASVAPEASGDAATPETDAIVTDSTDEQTPPNEASTNSGLMDTTLDSVDRALCQRAYALHPTFWWTGGVLDWELTIKCRQYLNPNNFVDSTPTRALCNRTINRFPASWLTMGTLLGDDLIDTCRRLLSAQVVGDCALNFRGSCPGADLRGAQLIDVDMSEMNLSGADLRGANLSGAIMPFVNLRGANLDGARFDNAQLYGVNLLGASITGTSFAGAELRSATWIDGRRCSLANIKGRCG